MHPSMCFTLPLALDLVSTQEVLQGEEKRSDNVDLHGQFTQIMKQNKTFRALPPYNLKNSTAKSSF